MLVEWSPRERAKIEEVAVNDMLVGGRKKESRGKDEDLAGSSRMSFAELKGKDAKEGFSGSSSEG